MLGKTNITTLTEGAVVTEIEDYKWVQMQSGVHGNFVKAVYANDCLAAITADGTIAYTMDGEVWQTSALGYEGCKLYDICWDGDRFVVVGSYLNESSTQKRLIVVTENLTTYSIVQDNGAGEILSIYPQNGIYILIVNDNGIFEAVWAAFEEKIAVQKKSGLNATSYRVESYSITKNTDGILIYHTANVNPKRLQAIKKINSDGIKVIDEWERRDDKKEISVFECKNTMYALELFQETGYNLYKITDSNEKMTMCTGQNFMFVDGVYFNECQLFINSHEMLIVKKNETLADKTIDDLIEIAPELTMNCITKAFGQLYIFGNQGAILKSSVETNNEEAVTVQTLSAKKALADAKQYTDERYADLEARITALESALKTE